MTPSGLRIVNDSVTPQGFHIRTKSTVFEVRFKNSNKLRATRLGALLFHVVLKRFNNRGWINRAGGLLVSAQYKSNKSRPRFRWNIARILVPSIS